MYYKLIQYEHVMEYYISGGISLVWPYLSKTTCLRQVSVKAANHLASYGDPWHDEARIKQMSRIRRVALDEWCHPIFIGTSYNI